MDSRFRGGEQTDMLMGLFVPVGSFRFPILLIQQYRLGTVMVNCSNVAIGYKCL